MKNGADLHVHTNVSDGLHSPAEVVRMAMRGRAVRCRDL